MMKNNSKFPKISQTPNFHTLCDYWFLISRSSSAKSLRLHTYVAYYVEGGDAAAGEAGAKETDAEKPSKPSTGPWSNLKAELLARRCVLKQSQSQSYGSLYLDSFEQIQNLRSSHVKSMVSLFELWRSIHSFYETIGLQRKDLAAETPGFFAEAVLLGFLGDTWMQLALRFKKIQISTVRRGIHALML